MEVNDLNKRFNFLIKKILENLSNSNKCQVKYKDIISTGYLFTIPLQDYETVFPVLITTSHPFINKNIKIEKIKILVKDIQYQLPVLSSSRAFYENHEYNIIFIEIKENDCLYLEHYNMFKELNADLFKVELDLFNSNISLNQDTFEVVISSFFGLNVESERNNVGAINNLINNNIGILSEGNNQKFGTLIQKTLENFSQKVRDILINIKINISSDSSEKYKEYSKPKKSLNEQNSWKEYFNLPNSLSLSDIGVPTIIHQSEQDSSNGIKELPKSWLEDNNISYQNFKDNIDNSFTFGSI